MLLRERSEFFEFSPPGTDEVFMDPLMLLKIDIRWSASDLEVRSETLLGTYCWEVLEPENML